MPDTVLSVDDLDANRYTRARALRAAGFEVIEAGSGMQALELARAVRPALVLLDVRLPDVDGFTVCRRLKADPRTAAIPVLHITAVGRAEEDLPQSIEHLSDGYLREPVPVETLVATVKALVRAREGERVRQDAEMRAREAERRAAQIPDSMADPVVAFDRQWRYTYVSRRASEELGKDPVEMIGKSMWDLFPEDADSGFERACEQAWAEGRPVTCERYSKVLGRWCEDYVYPTADGAVAQWRDIADRKRAEETLTESQRRLELALDAAELGTWELDVESGVVTASPKTCAMFEFDSARPEAAQWIARLVPDDRERVQGALQRAAAGGPKYETEYRVLRSDGSIRWVFATAERVTDAAGRGVRLIGVAQDITERKEAEQALLRERELLSGIVENIPVMLCLYDPKLQQFQLNREFRRVLGWTDADANTGDFMAKVYPDPDVRAQVAEFMRSLTPGWREFSVTSREGLAVPSEWANIRLSDERMIGIGMDLRARNQAEDALRASERRYSALFGNKTNAIAHCRVITGERGEPIDYVIIEVNSAYETVTGIRKADVEGRRATEIWPDIRSYSFDYIGSYGKVALEGGELNFEACFEGLNQWLSVYVYSPKKGECIVIFTDISERKRAEAALKESEERFRTLADNIAQFAWMAEPDGSVFWYNRRWYEYTGATFEEMRGWGQQKVLHPEHVARVAAGFQRSLESGETWEDTFPLRGRDGEYRWFLSRAMPVRDAGGRIVRWFGTNTDVTERMEAERRLRESEERLLLTLDAAQVGAFEFWPATGEVHLDARAKALFGMSPDEELDYVRIMAKLHPEDRNIVEEDLQAAFRPEAGGSYESQYRVIWPDGSLHWQVSKGRVHFDAEGRPQRMAGIEIDVTEQKTLEEQLRQHIEEIQTVLDVTPAAILVAHDPECRLVLGNRMANELYEAAGGENLSGGRPDQPRRYFRNGRQLSAGELPIQQAAARGEEVRDSEVEVLLPSGAGVTLLGNAIPLWDPEGRVRGCVGAFLDTTQRKQATEELQRQKRDYETLAENAPEVIARLDRELRYTYINEYGVKLYDLPREQILGRTCGEIGLPPVRVAFWNEHLNAVFATGEQRTVDFKFNSPKFGRQHFSALFVPERDSEGQVVSILAITRDVTQLRRAEEELLESERRLKTVIENLAEGLMVFDPRGNVLHWNRAAFAMHEFESGNEVNVGRLTESYELRTLEGAVLSVEEWPISRLLRGEPVNDVEVLVRHRNRPWERTFSYSGTLVRDEAGKPWLGLLAMRDITERKRTEERLRQAQKLESIGLLAGGIAHDFNNLLTGILGNASMVLDEVEHAPRSRIQEVIHSAERAAHLTRQLLAYSGKGQFVVRDIDLSEAVNEMGDLVQFSIPKSVDLVLNLQKRLPMVRMDPGQLQQILMNLVINAGEAIGEGRPGRISVRTGLCDIDHPFVDALGEQVEAGRYVCVEVTDTGTGIDEQTKAKIFDPFFTTKFTGRGLGLAAVSGIVRSQKGAITVDSKSGAGSTFRVLFPAREDAGRAAEEPAGTGGRGTVLVVDDEASVRDFIRTALRRRGFRVLAASDGREALAVCEGEAAEPKAVVLDVVMPIMGANDLLPEMKAKYPNLKVLLTSGYSESEARRLCAAYPGAAFIQKPYTAQQIGRAVEDLLGVKS